MNKIGIKILKSLDYEAFESFQYLLDYDFDYDMLEEYIKDEKIIELDIDDDEKEDREEDIEALLAILGAFDREKIAYELYMFEKNWERIELGQVR